MSNDTNLDAGALLALVKLQASENFLRALLAWALYHVMEAGTALEERETMRNGYRRRDRETRVGTIPDSLQGHKNRIDSMLATLASIVLDAIGQKSKPASQQPPLK